MNARVPTHLGMGQTPEQKLAAIIEAQGRAWRYRRVHFMDRMPTTVWFYSKGEDGGEELYYCHVLQILLDPEGLKAAYCQHPGEWDLPVTERIAIPARHILDAWLSKPEGDPVAAIDTAFSLLPHEA